MSSQIRTAKADRDRITAAYEAKLAAQKAARKLYDTAMSEAAVAFDREYDAVMRQPAERSC